jgi:hypothetical protein
MMAAMPYLSMPSSANCLMRTSRPIRDRRPAAWTVSRFVGTSFISGGDEQNYKTPLAEKLLTSFKLLRVIRRKWIKRSSQLCISTFFPPLFLHLGFIDILDLNFKRKI